MWYTVKRVSNRYANFALLQTLRALGPFRLFSDANLYGLWADLSGPTTGTVATTRAAPDRQTIHGHDIPERGPYERQRSCRQGARNHSSEIR